MHDNSSRYGVAKAWRNLLIGVGCCLFGATTFLSNLSQIVGEERANSIRSACSDWIARLSFRPTTLTDRLVLIVKVDREGANDVRRHALELTEGLPASLGISLVAFVDGHPVLIREDIPGDRASQVIGKLWLFAADDPPLPAAIELAVKHAEQGPRTHPMVALLSARSTDRIVADDSIARTDFATRSGSRFFTVTGDETERVRDEVANIIKTPSPEGPAQASLIR